MLVQGIELRRTGNTPLPAAWETRPEPGHARPPTWFTVTARGQACGHPPRGPSAHRGQSALGHRLRQHHFALALWLTEQTADGGGLIQLDRLAVQLDRLAAAMATELGCTAQPLFVPRDESLA